MANAVAERKETKLFSFNKEALKHSIAAAAAAAKRAEEIAFGTFLLRFSNGEWYLGLEKEVVSGEKVLIDPATFEAGFISWVAGQVNAEVMKNFQDGPVTQADLPPLPKGAEWNQQMAVSGMLMDDGTKATMKLSSLGGRRALGALIKEINTRFEEDEEADIPVVKLSSGAYTHKIHGEIFFPVLEIEKWVTFEEAEKIANSFEA